MDKDDSNIYDFLINDEDEAMLLLYVRESAPEHPTINIDFENKSAVLSRNASDSVELSDIPDEIMDALEETDKLLVCELSMDADEKDTQIVYAYEAEIMD